MRLFKQRVYKDNKRYSDLYLVWTHEGKTYKVRIEPRFRNNKALLLAQAELLDDIEI